MAIKWVVGALALTLAVPACFGGDSSGPLEPTQSALKVELRNGAIIATQMLVTRSLIAATDSARPFQMSQSMSVVVAGGSIHHLTEFAVSEIAARSAPAVAPQAGVPPTTHSKRKWTTEEKVATACSRQMFAKDNSTKIVSASGLDTRTTTAKGTVTRSERSGKPGRPAETERVFFNDVLTLVSKWKWTQVSGGWVASEFSVTEPGRGTVTCSMTVRAVNMDSVSATLAAARNAAKENAIGGPGALADCAPYCGAEQRAVDDAQDQYDEISLYCAVICAIGFEFPPACMWCASEMVVAYAQLKAAKQDLAACKARHHLPPGANPTASVAKGRQDPRIRLNARLAAIANVH